MALATVSLLGLGTPLSRSSLLAQELPSRTFLPSLHRSTPRGAVARVPIQQARDVRGGVALAATGAVAAVGVRRKWSRRSKAMRRRFLSAVQRQAEGDAGGEDPLLAEAKAAAEAAKLRLEAEKLRAEAAALQQGVTAQQFSSRAERLLGGTVGIGLAELITRFKESETLDLTEEQGQRLAKACGLGQIPADVQEQLRKAEAFNLPNLEEIRSKATPQPVFFRKEELTSEAFDRELRLIEADVREEKRVQAQAEARNRAAQEGTSQTTESQPGQQAAGAPPPGQAADPNKPEEPQNTDTSMGSRIAACAAYILPLAEAFRLAYPLAVAFPIFAILFGPVALVSELVNVFPFGSSLLLIVFIFLAQWKEQVPRLVRFNLEQAVLVDIALTIPTLILSALEYSGAPEPAVLLGGLTFLGVFAIFVYCAATNLEGKEPDGIPVISKTAKNVIERQTFFGD